MKRRMELSVVIPTRDHAELLDRTLASLAGQQYPSEQFEIIVIDNGSSDHTPAVCESWAKCFPDFRCIFEPEPGLHVGRNLGMKLARADILVYTDDDVQAEPSWLASIVQAFEDPKVGLVGGNNLPDYECPPPAWLEGMKQKVSFGWAIPPLSVLDFGTEPRDIDPAYVWGCNYSIRKSLLREIGGFHPDGMPKELLHLRGDGESYVSAEVVKRGMRIRFSHGATIHHFTPASRMTASYIRNRYFQQGVSKTYAVIRKSSGLTLRSIVRLLASMIKLRAAGLVSRNSGRRAMFVGSAEGILWHMQHCRRNPETITWILKSDYNHCAEPSSARRPDETLRLGKKDSPGRREFSDSDNDGD